MRYYIIGHYTNPSHSKFKEFERTTSKIRARHTRERYERVYKRKFVILSMEKKLKIK